MGLTTKPFLAQFAEETAAEAEHNAVYDPARRILVDKATGIPVVSAPGLKTRTATLTRIRREETDQD